MSFQVTTQANFLRGLNLATGKLTTVPGTVVRNSNMLYTKRGSLVTVDGTKKYTRSTELAVNPTVVLMAATKGPAGMFPLKAAYQNGNGSLSLENLSTNPSTYITNTVHVTHPANYRIAQMFNAKGYVFICNGNDAFSTTAIYDFYNNVYIPLTISAGLTVAPQPAHGIFHTSRVWLWNTAETTDLTNGVGPSSLSMSDSTLTNFPITNQVFIDRDDGTQGQGLAAFTSSEAGIAPTETLIAFKDFATYQITGLLSGSGALDTGTFSITRAQTDMGCVAPRSIQFAPGFGIVRMTHFGIAVFDGVKDTLISEEIRPYLFQSELDVQPMDWSRVSQCQSTVSVNPPMYIIAIPTTPSTATTNGALSRLLCYDLVLKAWTVIDLPTTGFGASNVSPLLFSCVSTIKIPSFTPITLVAPIGLDGDNRWNIMRWLGNDPMWENVAINWKARLPDVFAKNPSSRLYFRRSVLRAKTSNVSVTAKVDFGGIQKTTSTSQTFKFVKQGGSSLYGSAIYGTSTYGDAYPDLVQPFSLGTTAFSANAEYSGTGRIEILGNDWHFVPKPEGAFAKAS